MTGESEPESYSIKVAPGVVTAVIRLAAVEVPGVAALPERKRLRRILPPRHSSGGIRLDVQDGMASVDVHLLLEREADMQAVCSRVQRSVVEALTNLVGMPVREVNVYVQDVQ